MSVVDELLKCIDLQFIFFRIVEGGGLFGIEGVFLWDKGLFGRG